jgi:hypothetical protein
VADPGTTPTETASGVELIAAERRRQVEAEGWTSDHDDEHTAGEMADAAALYIARVQYGQHGDHLFAWKTPAHGWIKEDPDKVRMLVKAGALIAAEIDRLQRSCAGEVCG